MLLLLKRLPVFQFFRSAVVLLPARGRLPVAGVTGTRVQVRPQVVRSLQAATPLGVDRPDAASANTTGPLVLAGAAPVAPRGLSPLWSHRSPRPRWSAGPYGSSGRRAAGP